MFGVFGADIGGGKARFIQEEINRSLVYNVRFTAFVREHSISHGLLPERFVYCEQNA